jgi:hypothetical protein
MMVMNAATIAALADLQAELDQYDRLEFSLGYCKPRYIEAHLSLELHPTNDSRISKHLSDSHKLSIDSKALRDFCNLQKEKLTKDAEAYGVSISPTPRTNR